MVFDVAEGRFCVLVGVAAEGEFVVVFTVRAVNVVFVGGYVDCCACEEMVVDATS